MKTITHMKQLLTTLLLCAALSTHAQRDTSRAEHLMYHYDSLYKALEDSQRVHKDNILLRTNFLLQQRDYIDSTRKYCYIAIKENEITLEALKKLKMLRDDLQKLMGDTLPKRLTDSARKYKNIPQ